MDEATLIDWATGIQGLLQRIENEVGTGRTGDPLANDPSGEAVY
jgi:hypothetical protein